MTDASPELGQPISIIIGDACRGFFVRQRGDMGKIIDLTGKRFGRWVALALHPERSRLGLARWVCRCDCGSERIVLGNNLRSGATTSCGSATCCRRAHRLIDLTGRRFDRWHVIALIPERQRSCGRPFVLWLCRCDCGSERIVRGSNLQSGCSKSCGCLNTKHGQSRPRGRAYQCWQNMKARYLNPQHRQYPDYGGRGITVCERWLIFENFYADMGDPPDGLSIDRINNDGNYEPRNCRWATVAEQLANRRPQQKRRRKRSSLAQLQRYLAAVSREAAL
jgi:hypothetical protein